MTWTRSSERLLRGQRLPGRAPSLATSLRESATLRQFWAYSISGGLCTPVLCPQLRQQRFGLLQISRVKALPIATLSRAAVAPPCRR